MHDQRSWRSVSRTSRRVTVEQHPPGKFELLIDVLSVSSSAVSSNVEVPEMFRAGMYSVRSRDELDG